jgi:putative iron-regulated protein
MKKTLLLFTLASISLTACKKEDPKPVDLSTPFKAQAKETYTKIAWAVYEDSYLTAVTLKSKIDAFVANPTAQGLEEAKQAWLDAREPYGQSEVFRFTDGPIDVDPGYEGYINAWPLDESFIDYVQGDPTSGIINDLVNFPVIDKAMLIDQNENGSETNIATGYHAIEFLLWGQDFSASGPGNRSHLDYQDGGGTATNEDRRRTYLSVCAELLVDMLEEIKNQWDPNVSGNYRANFLKLSDDAFLQKIFGQTATLSYGELAGERLYVAYENQDQEDEHSCFSDNTHRDIILNAQGIQNLIEGNYIRVNGSTVSGASLSHVIAITYSDDATALKTMVDESVSLAESIPSPFDQALVNQDASILTTVQNLQAQGEKLVTIAAKFNITITL